MQVISGGIKNFNRLCKLLEEQRDIFLSHAQNVTSAVEVNADIVLYLRDKDINDISIDAMERDNRIFLSRIEHLTKKLDECLGLFSDVANMRTKKCTQKEKNASYQKCVQVLFSFYEQRRELHHQFQNAQDRWLDSQEEILSSYSE